MADTKKKSVVPERYLQALDGADPIAAQRKAPKRVKKLLKGLSEKQMARRPAEGKWSIKEIVAHLADGEIVLGSRVRFVAAQERPPLPGYDQDLFVANLGIERVKTKALLEAFAAARAVNVALLERLPEGAFDRVGLHLERGEESIRTMVAMYAGHDFIHERQIEAARDAVLARKSKPRETPDADLAKAARRAEKRAEKQAEKQALKQAEARKKAEKQAQKAARTAAAQAVSAN